MRDSRSEEELASYVAELRDRLVPSGVRAAMESSAAIQRTFLPFGGIASIVSHANDLHDRMVPASVRMLAEMCRPFERAASPISSGVRDSFSLAGKFERLSGVNALHASFGAAVLAEQARWMEPYRAIASIAAAGKPWGEIEAFAHAQRMTESVALQIARTERFDRYMGRTLGEDSHLLWSSHLKMTSMANLAFLTCNWSLPMGLLAEIDRPEVGASLAWLQRRRGKTVASTAALTPQGVDESGSDVVVEESLVCGICGEPMAVVGREMRWLGPKRGIRRVRIFPACSTCFKLEMERPGSLLEALEGLDRPPMLHVVRGSETGDGVPKGKLRIVPLEADEG